MTWILFNIVIVIFFNSYIWKFCLVFSFCNLLYFHFLGIKGMSLWIGERELGGKNTWQWLLNRYSLPFGTWSIDPKELGTLTLSFKD